MNRFKTLWRRHNPQRAQLSVRKERGGATVEIGARSFVVRGGPERASQELVDFALYGAAGVAMTHNITLEVDQPVSRGALSNLRRIARMLRLWCVPGIHPQEIVAHNVVEDPPATEGAGVMCLSGGLDSTYVALDARERHGLDGALLVAGADYARSESAGFRDLRQRVERIAAVTGLELSIVETDVRELGFHWGMFHTLNLAMCLHFVSPAYGFGVIAAGYELAEQFNVHPWGENRAIVEQFGTPAFPISYLGQELGRTARARAIASDPRGLVEHLSVCWQDTQTGGNCGDCEKCVRSKLNFAAAGGPIPPIFANDGDLVEQVDALRLPRRPAKLRNMMVFLLDVHSELPDGDLRERVGSKLQSLERRLRRRAG